MCVGPATSTAMQIRARKAVIEDKARQEPTQHRSPAFFFSPCFFFILLILPTNFLTDSCKVWVIFIGKLHRTECQRCFVWLFPSHFPFLSVNNILCALTTTTITMTLPLATLRCHPPFLQQLSCGGVGGEIADTFV